MDNLVAKEFAAFEEAGINSSMLENTWKKVGRCPDFLRYQIISSQVFGPDGPIKNLLDVMVNHYAVPDVDFIYYLHDVLRKDFFYDLPSNAPIFVSAKHRSLDRVILFNDWYYDINNLDCGWNSMIESIEKTQPILPWTAKINTLFWRGANTDGHYSLKNWHGFPRGFIVYLSQYLHIDLIDASFTHIYSFRTEGYEKFQRFVRVTPYVSIEDHLKFKYQILLDGVTCSYPGTQWRLLSGCLTLKQDSDEIMWFSHELIPWQHYIPVDYHLSDVVDKICWAKSHDAHAAQIAENARQFALTHLMPEHILLYCYKVLLRYASLFKASK